MALEINTERHSIGLLAIKPHAVRKPQVLAEIDRLIVELPPELQIEDTDREILSAAYRGRLPAIEVSEGDEYLMMNYGDSVQEPFFEDLLRVYSGPTAIRLFETREVPQSELDLALNALKGCVGIVLLCGGYARKPTGIRGLVVPDAHTRCADCSCLPKEETRQEGKLSSESYATMLNNAVHATNSLEHDIDGIIRLLTARLGERALKNLLERTQ